MVHRHSVAAATILLTSSLQCLWQLTIRKIISDVWNQHSLGYFG